MRKSAEIIMEKYQVRKTEKQKQAFREWLEGHLSEYGYRLIEEKYSKTGSNLVVGDVRKARVVLTAHYDTQPNFFAPVVMGFSNWISFGISQIIMLWPMLLFFGIYLALMNSFPGNAVVSLAGTLVFVAYFFQILCGIANKHTANDNTSGVATLISILEDLPQEDRHKVCVVFFDQEELGLIGSKKFQGKYKTVMKNKPLLNFDCVSDGQTLTFVMKKKFRDSKDFELLKEAAQQAAQESEKKLRFADALWNIYMSDQLFFPKGVGIVAAKKAPMFGYYIDRIHSKWDTKFDAENIALLTDTTLRLIRTI